PKEKHEITESAQHFPLVEQKLDEDVDLAAAGQPDRPGLLVRDPVREEPRAPALEHLAGVFVHVRLDTPARDRSRQLAALRDPELRADWPRRRTPGRDD